MGTGRRSLTMLLPGALIVLGCHAIEEQLPTQPTGTPAPTLVPLAIPVILPKVAPTPTPTPAATPNPRTMISSVAVMTTWTVTAPRTLIRLRQPKATTAVTANAPVAMIAAQSATMVQALLCPFFLDTFFANSLSNSFLMSSLPRCFLVEAIRVLDRLAPCQLGLLCLTPRSGW